MKHFKKRARHNLFLFILSFIYIFVLGLFESIIDNLGYYYFGILTLIFYFSILSINETKDKFFYTPLVVITLTWVSEFLDFPLLTQISTIASLLFFIYIIVYLVIRVASSKEVGSLEFLFICCWALLLHWFSPWFTPPTMMLTIHRVKY